MANSVPVTSLAAESVFGAVNLTVGAPAVNPCLPYLQVSGYEYWASTTNDRANAVKVATSPLSFYQHTAAVVGQTYWYWAKSVDASGNVSDFYPATTTSTVSAAAKTAASLSLSMSAPAIVVAADAAGVVGSFASAVSTAKVLDGAEDITSGWTLTATGVGVTVSQSGAVFSVTGMAADNGYFDVQASRAGYPNLTARVTVAKSKAGQTGATGDAGAPGSPGSPGANAAALNLTATSQIFRIDKAGAVSPASVTLTAQPSGGLSGTATWTVTAGTATLTGTGNTRTLTYANLGSETATIQASLGGYSDTITIAKLREGLDGSAGSPGSPGSAGAAAVVGVLSNEAATIPTDVNGTVTSYAGAVTTLSVYEGTADVSASWAVSGAASSGLTFSASGKTFTVTGMTVDAAYLDITATRSGYSPITKRFNISKVRQGLAGPTGNTGTQGARGSGTFYVSGQNAWSDSVANTAAAAGGGKQLNDVVTQYNASTFSQTRSWNGSAWVVITQAIDGNLLISGSVGATQISASYVYAGVVNASQVNAGTFTGRTFQTSATGKRVVIDAVAATVVIYDASSNIVGRLGGSTDGGIWGTSVSGSSLSAFGAVVQGSQHGYYATSSGTATGSCFYAAPNISSRGLEILKAANNAIPAAEIRVTGGTGNGLYINNTGSSGITLYGRAANVGSHGVVGENTATLNSVQGGLGYLGVNPGAGAFGVYAGRGGVAPFTGQHDGVMEAAAVIEPGDILVDVRVLARPSINDAITLVARSSQANQKTAVGVFVSRRQFNGFVPAGLAEDYDAEEPDEGGSLVKVRRTRMVRQFADMMWNHDLVVMNSLGEGLINVCARGGNIEAGDFLTTSPVPGKGMRQVDGLLSLLPDGILRNHTVARARESVTFTGPNQIRQIACIYLCG